MDIKLGAMDKNQASLKVLVGRVKCTSFYFCTFPFGEEEKFDQISEGWGGVQNVPSSAKWATWNF